MSEETPKPVVANVFSLHTRKPVDDADTLTNGDLFNSDEFDPNDKITDIILIMMSKIREEIGVEAWNTLDQAVLIVRAKEGGEMVFTSGNIMGPELVGALETTKMLSFNSFMAGDYE